MLLSFLFVYIIFILYMYCHNKNILWILLFFRQLFHMLQHLLHVHLWIEQL